MHEAPSIIEAVAATERFRTEALLEEAAGAAGAAEAAGAAGAARPQMLVTTIRQLYPGAVGPQHLLGKKVRLQKLLPAVPSSRKVSAMTSHLARHCICKHCGLHPPEACAAAAARSLTSHTQLLLCNNAKCDHATHRRSLTANLLLYLHRWRCSGCG